MNKEQQELLDDVYEKYCKESKYNFLISKDAFINSIKRNLDFAEEWGLKIEEREKIKNTAYSLKGKWFEIDSNNNLCYCGNPIDMTDPDCVEYNLCKEHSMDV
jgi:hypothetical protein